MTRVRVFLALCVACLGFAAPAAAAPFTPELRLAYGLAVQHWGILPAGCSSLDRQIVPNEELPDALAEASQPEPGEVIPCFLYIRAELANPTNFIRACAVIRHEVGHLEGFGHSPDPRNIMYPQITLLPSECWRASLWLMNHPNYRRGGPRYA
jgi:hypothetical protein